MYVNREQLSDLLRNVLALCWGIESRPQEVPRDILEAAADIEPVANDLLEQLEGPGPKAGNN